jgi:hypothetical protein
MKGLLQERLNVELESPQVLRERRRKLYSHLKSRGRYYEAFEVARMEMKFGISNLEQLGIFRDYLKLIGKFYAHNATIMNSRLMLDS